MRWIDDIDDFLLNVMLEEQNNGNKPNQNGILMLTLICVKSVMQYSVMQLRKVT